VGAGTLDCTLLDDYTGSGPMWEFSFNSATQTVEVMGFDVQSYSTSAQLYSPVWFNGLCNGSTCATVRASNMIFSGFSEDNNSSNATSMIVTNDVFGVLDHNTGIPYAASGSGDSEFVNCSD
jgi:hypothetical protein